MSQDVNIKIKVDDKEVVASTESVNRLKKAADDLGKPASSSGNNGLTQQEKLARFMESNMPKAAATASNAMTQVETATSTVTKGMGGLASAGGPVVIALAAVALAIVAVIAAAIELAKKVFALTKAFADYATEIRKISEETGLTSQTVSALKHEFEAQGRSISDLNAPLTNFRKLIGEAAAGSVDAQAKLKQFGLVGTKSIYDIGGAFKQALLQIADAPTEFEKIKLAVAGFGEEGALKLLPFLRDLPSGMAGASKAAEALGLIMSEKDVKASKEFTRALADLKGAWQGIEFAFGREFLETVANSMKHFTEWTSENKNTINAWSVSAGNAVSGVVLSFEKLVKFLDDHPVLTRVLAGAVTFGQSEGVIAAYKGFETLGSNQSLPKPGSRDQIEGRTPTPGAPAADPAAVMAQLAKEKELADKATQARQKEFDAAIELWEIQKTRAEKTFEKGVKELDDAFTKEGNTDAFRQGLTDKINTYRAVMTDAINNIGKDWIQNATNLGAGPNALAVINAKIADMLTAVGDTAVEKERQTNDKIAALQKKRASDALAATQEELKDWLSLQDKKQQYYVETQKVLLDSGAINERQFINESHRSALETLSNKKEEIQYELTHQLKGITPKEAAYYAGELAKIDELIKQETIRLKTDKTSLEKARDAVKIALDRLHSDNASPTEVDARRKFAAGSEQLGLEQQIAALSDELSNKGVNDGFKIEVAHLQDVLELRNRELNAVIAVNRAQLELSLSMEISNNQIRAGVYEHLAQQKTLSESIADGINKTYDTITGKLDAQIDKMFKWSKGYLSFITEPLKAIAHNSVSKLFSGVVDGLFPGLGLGSKMTETNNPVARPIVDKLDQIHTTLKGMGGIGGGSAFSGGGSGASGGGFLGRILGAFGIGGGGGSFGSGGGIGGTPNFNGQQDLWSSGGFGNGSGPARGGINLGGLGNVGSVASGGPGGFFSKIFGGASGLAGMLPFLGLSLGSRAGGGSGLSGILGGLGGLALGGAAFAGLGGLGALVSAGAISAGTSAAAFALLTNPFTIAAGAALIIGGILLKRNKQRRKDETTRNQGTLDALDALKQFDGLITNVRQGGDPAAAIAQGTTLGQQVREQYLQMANGLKDKKTRNIALADVSRIDSTIAQKMAELKAVAEIAQGAADRSKRILPEFAGGVFISQGFRDFQRYNGMLGGSWTGKDYRRALLADAEMVLNPNQQNRVRAIAGFDVFSGAGIPNYPNTTRSVGMAGGGIASGQSLALAAEAPNIIVQPSFVLELSGVSLDDKVEAFLTSDTGIRTQIQVNKKLKKSGDI